jgi:anti-anti-sigma factor
MSNAIYCNEALRDWQKEQSQVNFEKLVATFPRCESADKTSFVNFAAGVDNTLICRFTGRMDSLTAQALESSLVELAKCLKTKVIFDIENVIFIASAFLRVCLVIAKLKGDGNFGVVNPCPNSLKVFMISGLDQLLIRD